MKIDKERLNKFVTNGTNIIINQRFMLMTILFIVMFTSLFCASLEGISIYDKINIIICLFYIIFVIWFLLNYKLTGGYNFLAIGGMTVTISILTLIISISLYMEMIGSYYPFHMYHFIISYILVVLLMFYLKLRSINKISLDESDNLKLNKKKSMTSSIIILGVLAGFFGRAITFNMMNNLKNQTVVLIMALVIFGISLFSTLGYIILFKFFYLKKHKLLNEDCKKRKSIINTKQTPNR